MAYPRPPPPAGSTRQQFDGRALAGQGSDPYQGRPINDYGGYQYDARAGGNGPGYGGQSDMGQYEQNQYPRQPDSRQRNQYGHTNGQYMDQPPPRQDIQDPRSANRPPPPQQSWAPVNDRPINPNLSPINRSGDGPYPTFPTRRRGSNPADFDVERRMEALDLGNSAEQTRPPDVRPHTSNTNRQPPPRLRTEPVFRQMAQGRPMGYPIEYRGDDPRRMQPPKRSATMPVDMGPPLDSQQYPTQSSWQGPPPGPARYAFDSQRPPPRPATTTGSKQVSSAASSIPPIAEYEATTGHKPRSSPPNDGADDLLDDYFDDSRKTRAPEMPNFNAMPDSPARSTHEDLLIPGDAPRPTNSQPTSSAGYTAYRPPGGVAQAPTRTVSDGPYPRNDAGFNFDLPEPSNAYPPQGQAGYDYARPISDNFPQHQADRGGYREDYNPNDGFNPGSAPRNQYEAALQRGGSTRYSPDQLRNQNMRSMRPAGPPGPAYIDSQISNVQNPDSLPPHPTPFRPGLDSKPPPVRRYESPPQASPQPVAIQGALERVNGQQPQQQQAPGGITMEELQRLREAARNNPSDYPTQLLLAQKLVDASSVLIDENGRADQKTRAKNRERYIFDAYKIVKKLSGQGYPPAMFFLADCYGQGMLGLEADAKEAFSLYQSAAKAGHPESAYRVAVCCEMGNEGGGGTRRDPIKAVQWYRRAAAMGDTPAMYKMGMILLKGLLGQARNPREALSWLKRAAERADAENPHALHELALLYENPDGNDAIIRDEEYARELLHQAGELGYKYSQYRLGATYEYGLMGCPVDPRQSIVWYTRAAAQGEHQSELALSGWYLTGAEGILQQSDTEAYLWARKAAMSGLAKAEYAMGYFTEVGIGVPANMEDAKRWYWKASSQNFGKARERLEDLRRGGAKMQKTLVSRSAVSRQNEGDCIVM